MKRRSHRLPVADTPHDDWVDESWTVDCVCGVNFDDGEEMVNCDECGVWVHTRCSRYVKGEKSFACHKCKRRNERDDNEETEVAQLLVELPTKTLRMDDKPYSSSVVSRRTVRRLWTEIPIEERVHVQGAPGGDPSLFSGLSSIFSPQLWKSTGHAPKKFNFRYREFPAWDAEENEQVKSYGGEDGKTVDNEDTAGGLCSWLEENKSVSPLMGSVAVKSLNENDKCEKVAYQKQMKKLEGECLKASLAQNTVNEDPSLPIVSQPIINSMKRKKEDAGLSEDHCEKKKGRMTEIEGVSMKKVTLSSRTASTISSDAEQLEVYEDRDCKAIGPSHDSMKAGDPRNSTSADHLSYGPSVGGHDDPKYVAAMGLEAVNLSSSGHNAICDLRRKEGDDRHCVVPKVQYSPIVNDLAASGSLSGKEKMIRGALHGSNGSRGSSTQNIGDELPKSQPIVEDMEAAEPEVNDKQIAEGLAKYENRAILLNTQRVSSSEVSANNSSGQVKMNDGVVSSSESDQKMQDVDRSTPEGGDKKDEAHMLAGDSQPKREPTGSEGSLNSRKSSSGHKHGSKALEEKSKFADTKSSFHLHKRKVVVSVGKSSSGSSASVMSKSSTSGSRSSSKVQIQSNDSKQRGTSDGNLGSGRENTSFDGVRDEERSGKSKKILKEVAKSSLSSASKASHSTKFSDASVHKRSLSDSNDSTLHSSSKGSKAPGGAAATGSGKSASQLQATGSSSAQIKGSDSGLQYKGEKGSLPGAHLSSKVTSQMQPPASSNPPATLSDEELALLLHQELNSSPRVPRVPRMRHAGSLPQITSPTAASMLLKRTSSSGGKDNSLTNRRKPKDLAKDGSHSSRDVCSEAKKLDRVPSGDIDE